MIQAMIAAQAVRFVKLRVRGKGGASGPIMRTRRRRSGRARNGRAGRDMATGDQCRDNRQTGKEDLRIRLNMSMNDIMLLRNVA